MKQSHRQSLCRLLLKNRETLASLERALKIPEWNEFETMGIGVLLSDVFQGVEQVLVLIIEKIHSRKLPKDESWHDTLLSTAKEMGLYPQEIHQDLRGMLRYRHVQRHGYGLDLDAEKIRQNALEAVKTYVVFEKHILNMLSERLGIREKEFLRDGKK